jgi:hypothetical protein
VNLRAGMRRLGSAAVFSLSAALAGCAAHARPCVSTACGTGSECVGNRCVPAGSEPVPRGTARVVLLPVAVAASEDLRGPGSTAVALGGARSRNAALYLRFTNGWKAEGEVEAAYLLLTPATGVAESPAPVPLEVWTAAGAWSADAVTRGVVPPHARPRAPGLAPPGGGTVRIDVLSLIHALRAAPYDDGLIVVAEPSEGPGVTILTGTAGTGAPRLELYVRGAGPRRAAW